VGESFSPGSGGRADAADEDDLDKDAGGGKRLAKDGEVAPQEAPQHCDRQRPDETGPGERAQKEAGGAAQRKRGERAETGAVGTAVVGDDGFKAAQAGPAQVGDAGQIAQNDRRTECNAGAQAAVPVHLAGERKGLGAEAGAGLERGRHRTITSLCTE
jgi:hypothetical protein